MKFGVFYFINTIYLRRNLIWARHGNDGDYDRKRS